MPLLAAAEMSVAKTLASIGYVNPFLPERIALEKAALGPQFVGGEPFLQYRPEKPAEELFPNARPLCELAESLLDKLRDRLTAGHRASEAELQLYEDLTLYVLYARHMSKLLKVAPARYRHRPPQDILALYDAYLASFQHYLRVPELRFPSDLDPDFIFAGLYQIERAFFHVFNYIVGGSLAAAKLRAAVWQSLFTHDMRRYSTALYQVMGSIPTLIVGPSGTGKELVARAIAYSRFIPFDATRRQFAREYDQCFHGLNLAALPSTLIESELFGHVRGAFTGATKDRAGYFDPRVCGEADTVFLDEIGELEAALQVKLLRVLQEREFRPVGDAEPRKFAGKIVAATHRDLAAEMAAGNFREDFYYRLCADRIETPSLRAQLAEAPEDLANFVRFIASQQLPHLEDQVEGLADEALTWIECNLGPDYAWPGNIRELEQCVRSVMIHGSYAPPAPRAVAIDGRLRTFLEQVAEARLSRDELLAAYASLAYAKCGSYRAAAQRLGTDWRTVQRLVQWAEAAPQTDGPTAADDDDSDDAVT